MSAAGVGSTRAPRRARDWVLVAVCVLLGGLAGFAYYQLQDPVYTAHSTVLVLPTSGGLDSSVDPRSGAVVIETEAEVANSAEVAAQAAKSLGGRITAEKLSDDSEVTVTPNSQVLTVTVQAGDPALARDAAQAISQAYLDQRGAAAKATLDATTKTLNARLDELKAVQAKQAKDLTDADTPSRPSKEAALNLTVAQIADINSRLVALQVQSTNGGSIISAATLPTSPTSPVLWIDLAAGLAIGALVGSGLLLLIDRRRQGRPATAVAAGVGPVASPPAAAAGALVAPVAAEPAQRPAAAAAEPVVAAAAAPRASDAVPAPKVLATVDLGETGQLGDADRASLQALCRALAESTQPPGPLALVGVDYHVLMTEAAFAVSDAWVAELGRHALVLADADTPSLAGRPTMDGRGLTDVLSGEWAAADTLTISPDGRAALLRPGVGVSELPPATQRQRLLGLWEDLDHAYGAAAVQVQAPFDSDLATSVVQSAGPVLVVVKSGLSQQQDLSYATEQLAALGLAQHVVGVISVSGKSRTAAPAVDLSPAASEPEPEPAAAKPAAKPAGKPAAARPAAAKQAAEPVPPGDAAQEDLARGGAGRAGS